MSRYLVLISTLCLLAVCHSTARINQTDVGNFIKTGSFLRTDIDQDYLANVDDETNTASKAGGAIKIALSETLTWKFYRSQGDLVDLISKHKKVHFPIQKGRNLIWKGQHRLVSFIYMPDYPNTNYLLYRYQ